MHKFLITLAVAFFTFILWIIFQADSGNSNVFITFARNTPYGDKIGHFFLFGILTVVTNLAFKSRILKMGTLNVYLGTVLVLVFVVLEELSQVFFPLRTVDIHDLIADGLGISCFTALTYWLAKKPMQKRKTDINTI